MLDFYEEIEEEFFLFGVQSPIKDESKFIYLLNKTFEWNLERINDLDVIFDTETFCYSTYLFEDPQNIEDYVYVIKNQSHDKQVAQELNTLFKDVEDLNKSRPLLNKYKTFRYLIKLPQESDPLKIKNLTLSPVEFIHHIQPIKTINNKEKKYFLI